MPKDKLDRSNADRAHSLARTVVASVPTQWHLAVLGYLADPPKWLTDRGIPIKSFMAGSRREPFKDAFPELPEELGNQILRDLYTRGLIQSESLGGMVTGPSVYQSLITAHGREFLQFVSAPEGEFH